MGRCFLCARQVISLAPSWLSRKPSGFRELSSASENSRFHPFPLDSQTEHKLKYRVKNDTVF